MTAPRVSTPCRSSSASARAVVRRVALASRSGSRDQRPATVGGPVRDGIGGGARRGRAGRGGGGAAPGGVRPGGGRPRPPRGGGGGPGWGPPPPERGARGCRGVVVQPPCPPRAP